MRSAIYVRDAILLQSGDDYACRTGIDHRRRTAGLSEYGSANKFSINLLLL